METNKSINTYEVNALHGLLLLELLRITLGKPSVLFLLRNSYFIIPTS